MLNRENPRSAFTEVRSYMEKFDIRFGNCEVVLSSEGELNPFIKNPQRGGEKMIDGLLGIVNVVSVANNKAMGFGWEGLNGTMEVLRRHHIMCAGAGRNVDEAFEPVFLEKNGIEIAFLCFDATPIIFLGKATEELPGIAKISVNSLFPPPHVDLFALERATKEITAASAQADFVVVSCHWGTEGPMAATYQSELGKAFIDAGADLVLGHHTHAPQGVEVHNGRLICHSLGNFVLDHKLRSYLRESGNDTMAFECTVTQSGMKDAAICPATLNVVNGRDQPEILATDDKRGQTVAENIEKLSKYFGTTLVRRDGKLFIDCCDS